MDKTEFNKDWIDRYVSNLLSAEEETEFELELLESPALQQQVETAMAIRQALVLERDLDQSVFTSKAAPGNSWQNLALAASVLLAVFSSTMYWKAGNEVRDLREEVGSPGAPLGGLLTVPVDIMRSSGSQIPDVVIKKPDGNTAVVLDIELGSSTSAMKSVHMNLVDQKGEKLLSWVSEVTATGRAQAVFLTDQLPVGQTWLEMTDADGHVLERRLIEFLP